MARPKEFDRDEALDVAIGVFCEHGFAGTSAAMLTEAMKIGRQSLYDTFGDKWQLYCSALQRYADVETQAHIAELRSGASAIEGIARMMARVVTVAHQPCLGVGSVSEFGIGPDELVKLRSFPGALLRAALAGNIGAAQAAGEMAADLDPEFVISFLISNIAALKLAARAGAGDAELQAMGKLALRALR